MTRAPAHSCPFADRDHPNLEGGASRGSWPHPATCTPHAPPRGGARAAKISAGGGAAADTRARTLRGSREASSWAPGWARAAGARLWQSGGAGARSAVQAARRAPPPNFPWSRRSRRLSAVRPRGVPKGRAGRDRIAPHPAPLSPPSPQPLRARGLRASVARPSPLPTAARAPAVPARLPLPPLSRPGRPRKPPGRSEVCATGARKDRVFARAVPFNHVRRTFAVVGSQEGYPVGARFRFVW